MRKLLKSYGSHGRSVRVFVQTFDDRRRQDLVRVEWREGGKRRLESLPNSRDNQAKAKAFAEGVADRLAIKAEPQRERLTLFELGERYVVAHPSPETWRAKSLKTHLARWKVILTTLTPERFIDSVTEDTVDALRKAMREQGYFVNQIANHVQLLKSVFRFARRRRYLDENPIADYQMKLSRDQRRLDVPEWTQEDCTRILAELSPRHGRQWRAFVAIVLDAYLGGRSNALLNLEWRDVDLNARTVHWRPELDKRGNDRVQPLPREAVYAFRVARVWRGRIDYRGPFVLPGARGKDKHTHPYRYQSLNASLKAAAKRAGVPWVDYRAMHGFRRMAVNNVLALTGNLVRAGQWIGDTDARTLSRSYVRARADELRDVAGALRIRTGDRTGDRSGDQTATGKKPEEVSR